MRPVRRPAASPRKSVARKALSTSMASISAVPSRDHGPATHALSLHLGRSIPAHPAWLRIAPVAAVVQGHTRNRTRCRSVRLRLCPADPATRLRAGACGHSSKNHPGSTITARGAKTKNPDPCGIRVSWERRGKTPMRCLRPVAMRMHIHESATTGCARLDHAGLMSKIGNPWRRHKRARPTAAGGGSWLVGLLSRCFLGVDGSGLKVCLCGGFANWMDCK